MYYKHLLAVALMGCLLPMVLAMCKPDCTGKNPSDFVEDPMNCTKYYICMAGGIPSDASLECQPGNIFNPLQGICSPGSACKASCVPPDCHLTCTSQVDLISDPSDCGVYWLCLAGGVVGDSKRCSIDAPYFDGVTCVKNKDKCCTDLCRPYCYQNVVQAPDPTNCTGFYMCEQVGQPNEDHHFYCGPNEVFDVSLGRCTEHSQCKPLCDDGSNNIATPGTGTTTTTISTSTTTTSTTTTSRPPGCMESWTCTAIGYFPKCTYCQPSYFMCRTVGEQGTLRECPKGNVFNTNPSAPNCIPPEMCPFNP